MTNSTPCEQRINWPGSKYCGRAAYVLSQGMPLCQEHHRWQQERAMQQAEEANGNLVEVMNAIPL